MTTALSLRGNQNAATTLTTANQLVTDNTGSTSTDIDTKVGTATGYGEIFAQGSVANWPSGSGLWTPSGKGWLYDTTALEGKTIVAGSWSCLVRSRISAGTITADVIINAYKYNATTAAFTLIGTMTLASQSFNTVNTNYTTTGTFNPAVFGKGDKLYMDHGANVSVASANSACNWRPLTCNNAGLGRAGIMELTTPGYVITPTSGGGLLRRGGNRGRNR